MPPSFRSDATNSSRGGGGRDGLFPTSQLEEEVTYRSPDYDDFRDTADPWRGWKWRHGTRLPSTISSSTSSSSLQSAHPLRSPYYEVDYRKPRVQTYSYSGERDVFWWPVRNCTCALPPLDKAIPSMTYEHHRCPRHPHRKQLPAVPEQFTYPWTVQTYRPTKKTEYGYKRGQKLPPSAFTAPPFVLHRTKARHPRRAHHPPPYSAPEHQPLLSRFLATPLTNNRLRRVDTRRVHSLTRDDVTPWDSASQVAPPNELSPWDSISQVSPLRRKPLPNTRAESERRWRTGEQQGAQGARQWQQEHGRTAADTPRPRKDIDPPPANLHDPSRRIFKGDYGHVKSDDIVAQAKRRQLKTV